jgi:hypothetical protein
LIQGGVDLVGTVVRALGTKRSRGIERIDTAWVFGLRWRIITTSLLIPFTP